MNGSEWRRQKIWQRRPIIPTRFCPFSDSCRTINFLISPSFSVELVEKVRGIIVSNSTIHLNIPCHCHWRKHFEERDKTENPFDWHLIRCVYPLSALYNVEQQKQTRVICTNIMIIIYDAFGGTRLVRPSRTIRLHVNNGCATPARYRITHPMLRTDATEEWKNFHKIINYIVRDIRRYACRGSGRWWDFAVLFMALCTVYALNRRMYAAFGAQSQYLQDNQQK